jgi:hypothetical protein
MNSFGRSPENSFSSTHCSDEKIQCKETTYHSDNFHKGQVSNEGDFIFSSKRNVDEKEFSRERPKDFQLLTDSVFFCEKTSIDEKMKIPVNSFGRSLENWSSPSLRSDESLNNKANETLINKEINFKLKKLKVSLYKNAKYDKKSACFWCTYEYDNPSCHIPKYENDKSIVGYGSFCTPECACSHLMKENLDDSTKFERYHLLNKTYGKAYNYNKNIKPAPDPFYLLDKYYGNMTIQEYRKILKSERTLIVLEKPFTRFLPELHEDNEEIMLNCNFQGNSFGRSPENWTSPSLRPGEALNNREIMENNSKKTGHIRSFDDKNKYLNSYDKLYENNMLKNNNNSVSVGNPPGIYKVKRQTDKVDEMSKTNIMKKLFT